MLLKSKFKVVWLQALAWHIVVCSWARTLSVLLYTPVFKWVLVNLLLMKG